MGKHESYERICWFRPGIKYPKTGDKIMMLFADGSIVIALYDDFANWLPMPMRWSRHPVGPKDLAVKPIRRSAPIEVRA